jgi:hypothetical protein
MALRDHRGRWHRRGRSGVPVEIPAPPGQCGHNRARLQDDLVHHFGRPRAAPDHSQWKDRIVKISGRVAHPRRKVTVT